MILDGCFKWQTEDSKEARKRDEPPRRSTSLPKKSSSSGPKNKGRYDKVLPSQWCCWNVTASGRACWFQLSSKPMLWFLGLIQSSRGWMPRSCWCCSIKTCLIIMLLCNNGKSLCVLEELVWTDPHKATRENCIELSHHGFLQWKVTLGT